MTEFLLRLNIPPGLEEDMVDLLLSSGDISGCRPVVAKIAIR